MSTMHALYLHGLASSPKSAKAEFFSTRLRADGLRFTIPDLNLPSFDRLSFKAIIDRVSAELHALLPRPTILMGSSLGALAALHLENALPPEAPRPKALVLLAPALDFRHNKRLTPEALSAWKTLGKIPVHHSGFNAERDLPCSFLEELENLPLLRPPACPALILHGTHDEVIGVEHSRAFAAAAPAVRLIEIDTDHQMLSAFNVMLPAVRDFLREL